MIMGRRQRWGLGAAEASSFEAGGLGLERVNERVAAAGTIGPKLAGGRAKVGWSLLKFV